MLNGIELYYNATDIHEANIERLLSDTHYKFSGLNLRL